MKLPGKNIPDSGLQRCRVGIDITPTGGFQFTDIGIAVHFINEVYGSFLSDICYDIIKRNIKF